MIERLEAIETRFKEIESELTKPEVLSNINKTKELSKEMRDLEETVRVYQDYKKTKAVIEETKEMQKDPDLGEMAKEELYHICLKASF